jgi:hypothetical protein
MGKNSRSMDHMGQPRLKFGSVDLIPSVPLGQWADPIYSFNFTLAVAMANLCSFVLHSSWKTPSLAQYNNNQMEQKIF